MRKHKCWFAATLIPVLLASCVMSEKPLSDDRDSKVDGNLIGTWHQVKTDGAPYAMTIGEKKGAPNVMEWVSVSVDDERQVKVDRFAVFTKPGKTKYISIAIKPQANVIGKYTTPDAKTFKLYLLDTQVIGKAVEDGKLQGKVHKTAEGRYSSVTLSNPPSKTLDYIERNSANCFAEVPAVYRKLQ